MPKLGTIVQGLLDRAGIKLEDSQLVELANVTLELPDEVVQGLQKNLFTLEDAQKSPDIKKHFTGQSLSTMDAKFAELIEELGLDELSKAELAKVTSTYDKPKALTTQIAKLYEKKAEATGSKEKNQLQKEIDDLKTKFDATGKEWEGKLTAEQQKTKDTIKAFIKKQIIANNNLTDSIDKDILVDTIQAGVDRILREKGAAESMNDYNELKLVSASDAALPFRMDNKDVTYQDIVNQFIADKKLVKVNNTPTAPIKTEVHNPNGGGDTPQFLGKRDNLYSQQLQNFQTAN